MIQKVLIVEDDLDSQELLTEILTMRGFHVESADCIDALNDLSDFIPDFILSDVCVPGAHSDGSIVEILRGKWGQSPKVILLSAHADLSSIARRFNVQFVQKPYSPLKIVELFV
ncbi:MAG: response regulator [Proteobacteria bacterium]|nr:MAG: response regulator [Pseudomonadota bacterium]